MPATPSASAPATALTVMSSPWVFTQRHPLDTSDLVKEAKERGVNIDEAMLRLLYRHRLLVPFVAVAGRRIGIPIPAPAGDPTTWSSRRTDLVRARSQGRLRDLSQEPFAESLPFTRPSGAGVRWWNGIVYSHYQLLALYELRSTLARRSWTRRGVRSYPRIRPPGEPLLRQMDRYRRLALALTAIEARYLPVIDQGWLRLTGADDKAWKDYRDSFDPVAMVTLLGYPAEDVRGDAEMLLFRAHTIDPLGSTWSKLIRHAPAEARTKLAGTARVAVDMREAAELLLRFHEDLHAASAAEPLPDFTGTRGWHPLRDRLSQREKSLDEELMNLGLSPHPRVVLAVEGETEELHAPLVWRALELPRAPELVRLLKLGGVGKDPVLPGVLAATPLLASQEEADDFWWGTKPPTCFFVAADPEGRYAPSKVEKTRRLIIDGIRSAITSQGAALEEATLEALVEIHAWRGGSCYEFAHFSDDELESGIRAVHRTCNGLSHVELVAALREVRRSGKDIKEVWSTWTHQPSKRELARALWPALEAKVHEAGRGAAGLPEIAELLAHAYMTAQRYRYHTFVWKPAPEPGGGPD